MPKRHREVSSTATASNATAPPSYITFSPDMVLSPGKSDIIFTADCVKILPTLKTNSAQIIIADPPYINTDHEDVPSYVDWAEIWVGECLRILKENGTMFIIGLSENLALILARIPMSIQRRWLVWHYNNKTDKSLQFWQRSHESIIVLWKNKDAVFHREDIREDNPDEFLKEQLLAEAAAAVTRGKFSENDNTVINKFGALPRDVIKIATVTGASGAKERVDHPGQKPLALCEKLLLSCRQYPPPPDPSNPNSTTPPTPEAMEETGYVLIPFAGAGTECLAAKRLGLPFIGIEMNEDYVNIIHERLTNCDM